MRKILLLCLSALVLLLGSTAYAQDFSNKGKEFWLCFPQHVPSSNLATLSIWITSDRASSGMVTMTNGAFSAPFNIPANGLQEIQIPHATGHISNGESGMIIQKSIKIKTDPGKPAVVAYAQQWGSARSAATLLLPTNVLGKKYYAISFTQLGVDNGSYLARSQFQIIATKPNTTVKITPRTNGTTGAPFTVNFPLAGDMYQYQSTDDLTGTLIESTGGGGGGAGCLPIAVFSGSSNITFGTNSCGGGNSYDPLFQQQYPISSWGKNFGFIPFGDYPNGNPYRVLASEDNTKVFFDGFLVATLNEGQIYPATFTSSPDVLTVPTSITADKPVAVIQYAQKRDCSGSNNGDPDMVILNPIEQNIDKITVFTSTQQNINRQWLNVLIKTIAVPSFTIDGVPPSTPFIPIPNIPGYSYLTHMFSPTASGSKFLRADSGFNAILYGFQQSQYESYAYSAGTNVKDLYRQVGVVSQYGIEATPSACVGASFKFKLSIPYCADSIQWDLSNLPGPPPQPPISTYTTCVPGPGGPDSTTVVNGKTIYWYSLPLSYVINTAGVYNVVITTYSPNLDGCGTEQEFDFDLTVYDPPAGNFTWTTNGCTTQPVQFTETTPQVPKTTYQFWWDFGDPASGPANNSTLRNPTHIFSGGGTYNVKYVGITTPGCLLDTVTHQVTVNDAPGASFTVTGPFCINDPVTFTDNSSPGPGATINKWTWDFGDGSPPVIVFAPNPPNQVHAYAASGTYNATLVVETATGCPSLVFTLPVIIGPNGTITLTSGPGTDNQTVCINTPIADITYLVGGGGTGAVISGLPAGVNGAFAGGVVTISGTPTVSGTFNYSVTSTGACVNPTISGTITVNDDATVTLTSAPGTDNQTVCINTPITTITYAVGGSGNGGSVSGLPAGVTGTFAGGVITISGSPSVSGIFNFTVNTTGPCIIPTASGRIVVTADATLTLTSAPGTDNQTVCINTPIVTITYSVGGTGTGGSVSGLPAGVTGTFAGGIITITGTPTVSGTFNYAVTTTGPCVAPTANGTITVTDDGTLTLTSAPGTDNQTVCINTPITLITYAVGGSGTGGTVSGLPAGVTGTFAGGVITISGSPSVSGIFNYTVNTTGPCIIPTASGRITVTDDGTITLTSAPGTDNQTVCINNPIVNITYAVGGTGTGGSVSGLPAGVTGTFAGGIITITGTPTVAGTFNYNVTTTGPCVAPTANGTITVTADGTLTLTSGAGTDNQNACINNPIIPITYAVGGSGTGGSVSGLPAGVTATFAAGVITITGSPTVSGVFNYTVTTTGPCITPTASGTISVTSMATIALTSGPGTDNQTVCINTPITNITYLVGGSGTGGSVSGLPAGVTGSFAGGIITITGSPTVVGTFNYTVATTGPCGTPTANGTITVDDNSTLSLSSGPGSNVQTVCINTPIVNITYAVGGGGTGASITAGALPAGVTGNFAGGVFTISGTPTVSGVFNFTITTAGPCINPTATGTITVTEDATLTLTSAPGTNNQTVCINTPIVNITYAVGGSGTGGSVSGLPAGVTGTFAGGVITITGTPSVAGTFNYTVNTTGPCVKPSATGTITVNDNSTLTLSSGPGSNVQSVCINTPITNITYAVAGGGTGASITGGAFPPGVSGVYSGGVFTISGTPTVTGMFNYTITTTGPCINPSASGSIFVTADGTLTLTSAPGTDNQTVCINTAITNITYAVGGTGTGGSVIGLPAGITGTYSVGVITISGTPSVAGTFNYTVNTTGPCFKPTATGTITVNDNSTLTLSSGAGSNIQTVCINTAITDITYAVGGGSTGASITAGSLPAGVTGSFAGGVFTISGTPAVSGTFNFTIGTTGPCINTSQSGTITVTADGTLALTSAAGTDNQTVCINTAIINIAYAIGGSGTGASITAGALPAGVNGVYAGGVFTISGTPTVSGVFNFTVGSAGPCVKPALTGTITINPDHAISLSSAASTTNQTVCSSRPIAPIVYTFSAGATGASVTGLPPGVTSSVSGSTLTINGNPAIAGTFNYSISTTGNNCITASASGTISVLQTPAVQFDPVNGICTNAPSFQVNALPASGIFTGTGITSGGMFSPSVAGVGNHTIRYTFTAANGCSNYQEQIIAVYPLPGINAGPDKFVLEGGQITLTPSQNATVTLTYLWTPSAYLNDPTAANPVVNSPLTDMTYTMTATTDKGCSITDQVFVKLLKQVAIPNIFSPNGDGVHDTWVIDYLDSYPGCTVDIYNRYGQHIYHSEGYGKPWDGTIKGNPVPIGTYYYIVNPKNGRKIMSGYVDVIR